MLAKLGFQDPDRSGDRAIRHDDICLSLMRPEPLKRLREIVFSATSSKEERKDVEFDDIRPGRLEVPISKGHDQYKSTIGFIDFQFEYSFSYMARVHKRTRDPQTYREVWTPTDKFERWSSRAVVNVEVKTTSVPFGDVLRQINLYREYVKGLWVLVVDWEVSQDVIDMMKTQKILVIEYSKLIA